MVHDAAGLCLSPGGVWVVCSLSDEENERQRLGTDHKKSALVRHHCGVKNAAEGARQWVDRAISSRSHELQTLQHTRAHRQVVSEWHLTLHASASLDLPAQTTFKLHHSHSTEMIGNLSSSAIRRAKF